MEGIELFLDNFFGFIKISDLEVDKKTINKLWENVEDRSKIVANAEEIKIISATLVKNQENYIEGSINSSNGMADHIYVFDTGSEDRTLDVVRELQKMNKKIQLIEVPWVDDFAYMRNKVNDYLPEGWVFCIDSDEEITSDFDPYFLKLALSTIEYIVGDRDVSLCFKQTGGVSLVVGWPERLYRKSKTLNFWGCVHEELRSTKNLVRIKTQFTLLNNGRLEEEKARFNKEKRYYTLLLKNIEIEPDNVKWVALLPFDEGMRNSSWYLPSLEKFVSVIKEGKQEAKANFFYETVIVNYSKALMQLQRIDEARELLLLAKQVFPSNMSIVLLYYFLLNFSIQNTALSATIELKKDSELFEASDGKWEEYGSVVGLDDLMIKLLLKAEGYNEVFELLSPKIDEVESDLLFNEKEFIKKFLVMH